MNGQTPPLTPLPIFQLTLSQTLPHTPTPPKHPSPSCTPTLLPLPNTPHTSILPPFPNTLLPPAHPHSHHLSQTLPTRPHSSYLHPQGKWAPRKIENPAYFEDNTPFFNLFPIGAVGFELWTMNEDIYFDNVIITSELAVANNYAREG